MLSSVEDRAVAVLEAIGACAVTKVASGRYRRSSPLRPGVRYWSTSTPRRRQDHLGVQFFGVGVSEGERLSRRLERAGFAPHKPQPGQLTFARAVDFEPDGSLNLAALRETRRRLDELLAAQPAAEESTSEALSFWEFMQSSPLADIDLPDPDRSGRGRATEFLFEDEN